uniref:Ground-like domain-containing protein n=1 Tax=Globodera rostochiensis TaxID=31243 RepID=A0A914HE99_GLORO
MNTSRDASIQDSLALRQSASLRRSMRNTPSPSIVQREREGSAMSSASAVQRRSTDLAQSLLQRRSLLSQIGSAQSSVASSVSGYSPSLSLVPSKIDNRPAITIEIGTRLTRIGFAGEFLPQEIFRSEIMDPMDGPPSLQRPVHIFDRSRSCERKLLTTVNSRRVVIVESLLAPAWQRNAVARALFECPALGVHSVLFAPSHLLCTFPFNSKTCLVVDLGADEAVLFPVAEGVLMLNHLETSSSPCATALEQNVRRLMVRFGRLRIGDGDTEGRVFSEAELDRADKMRLWEDVAVRFCFATTAARGKRIQSHLANPEENAFDASAAAPGAELQFGTSHLLTVPGIVREGAAEILFSAGDEEDVRSVPQMILDCVANAAIDLRREFLRNLLLVGGVTRLPGFLARLKSELLGMLADGYHPKLSQQLHDIRFYQFPAEMKAQLFCAWLGGAMFGALDDCMEPRSLTREEWMATKRRNAIATEEDNGMDGAMNHCVWKRNLLEPSSKRFGAPRAMTWVSAVSDGHGLLGGLGLCGPPQPMCAPPPMCPILLPPMPCPPPLPPCPPCPPIFCPPPVICPPPVFCPPPPPPCPLQTPCTCAAPYLTGPPMGGTVYPTGMGQQQQPFFPSNDCCGGCATPCSFLAARAVKMHGARIFASPTAEGQEEDPTCNSEKLRQAINEHITSDPSESKRAIQKAAEEKLFSKINVICANGDFAYVAYTDAYCQATSGKVTCYAFRPLGIEKA